MPTFEAADFYNLEELLTADERRIRDAAAPVGAMTASCRWSRNIIRDGVPDGAGAGVDKTRRRRPEHC